MLLPFSSKTMSKLSDIIDLVEDAIVNGKKTLVTAIDLQVVFDAARKSEFLENELRKYKEHVCEVCDGDGIVDNGIICRLCNGAGMVESN